MRARDSQKLFYLLGEDGRAWWDDAPVGRRPVADPGAADQVVDGDPPAEVRVGAVGAIVAQDEVVAVGYLPRLTVEWVRVGRREVNVRLGEWRAVHTHDAVLDPNPVPGPADR